MSLTTAQRLDRLKVNVAELQWWRARETVAVGGWSVDGAPIALGEAWPSREGVVHFTATAEVPAHWPLGEARLSLNVGGESLLSLTADGRTIRYGLDPYHEEFPLHGRSTAIETDSVARLPFGEPVRQPHLNRANLLWLDVEVDRFWLLLTQVAETVEILGDHDVVPHMLTAAEETFRSLEWPSSTADWRYRPRRACVAAAENLAVAGADRTPRRAQPGRAAERHRCSCRAHRGAPRPAAALPAAGRRSP